MTKLWIVRAGKQGERELSALKDNRLYPGFLDVADLSKYNDRNMVLAQLRKDMLGAGEGRLRNFSAQLNQFVNTISIGDLVVMPRKLTNGVAIAKVKSVYKYDASLSQRHFRDVEWLQDSVARDVFKQDLRHSFGVFMTICEVKRNNALERVQAVLKTKRDPGPLLGKQGLSPIQTDEEPDEAEDYDADIEDIANQQIISLIKSEFAGHALANLVAEILNVEGYTTKISPPGPDGGVDVLAAGGAIGLGEDRICVQVKSGDGSANHDVVLRLIGSVSNTSAQTGLLVSIGGVNSVALKELENNFFKLRLWQMPELLKALFRTYDQLSDETRAKLPLKQIWAPIAGGA